MNTHFRFIPAFALLILMGAGCFSSQEVVIEDGEDIEAQDETSDTETFELTEGEYMVDAQASSIAWVGRKIGTTHNGTITIESGSLSVGEQITGEVIIDMTSIVDLDLENEQMNEQLVTHLKSEDFFAVETYPTSTFTIANIEERNNEENVVVTGTLTMKGIANEVSFPAQMVMEENGYRLMAQFEIDRSQWDVRFGSQTLLGAAAEIIVDDMITLELDVVLTN